MTPSQWYREKRAAYRAATGRDWKHRTDQESDGSFAQRSEISEIATRSGGECRALKAYGWDEIMMVANAILIRDILNGTHPQAAAHKRHRARA